MSLYAASSPCMEPSRSTRPFATRCLEIVRSGFTKAASLLIESMLDTEDIVDELLKVVGLVAQYRILLFMLLLSRCIAKAGLD